MGFTTEQEDELRSHGGGVSRAGASVVLYAATRRACECSSRESAACARHNLPNHISRRPTRARRKGGSAPSLWPRGEAPAQGVGLTRWTMARNCDSGLRSLTPLQTFIPLAEWNPTTWRQSPGATRATTLPVTPLPERDREEGSVNLALTSLPGVPPRGLQDRPGDRSR